MANVSYMLNDGKLYEIYLSERTVAPGRIAALVKEQAQEAARKAYVEALRERRQELEELDRKISASRDELVQLLPSWFRQISPEYSCLYNRHSQRWEVALPLSLTVSRVEWDTFQWPVSWGVEVTSCLPLAMDGTYSLESLHALGPRNCLPHMSPYRSCIEIGETLPNPVQTAEDIRRIHSAVLRAFSRVNAASPLVRLSEFPELIKLLPVAIRRWARGDTARRRPPDANRVSELVDSEWNIMEESSR